MPSEFSIDPWGLTGLFAVLIAWSLAVFLLRSGNRDRVTVLFAIVLIIEGFVIITAGAGLTRLLSLDVDTEYYLPHHIADCIMLVVYPMFLAWALPQKFLGVLRTGKGVAGLVVIALIALVDWWIWQLIMIAVLLPIMFILAFCLAIHAVLTARTSLARRRAKLFAVAFGLRDVAWSAVYLTGWFEWYRDDPVVRLIFEQIYAGSTLLYIPIVAYGILSVRLLNIQLQVRKGVKRGVMAAMFVALYFLITEGAATFLSDQFGSVLGLIGATVVVLVLTPLQKMADWFSRELVEVDESTEYKSYRKLQLYATAVEDALGHGELGPSQRALLDRLRESLGLSAENAARIESDLTQATA